MSEDAKAFDDAANAASFEASVTAPAPVESTSPAPPVETSTETADATGSTPVAEAKPVAPGTEDAPEYQNLLAKYGGDKNAAAKSYWATVNTASTLTKEKEALAAEIAALKAQGSTPKPPETPAAVQEIPTELRWYDDNMRAVEADFRATQHDRASYVAEEKRLDQEILKIENKLRSRDLTQDRDALNESLLEFMSEKRAIANHIAITLDPKLKGFDKEWQTLRENRSLRGAILEQAKQFEATREAKARSDEDAGIDRFHGEWFGTIDRISKDSSVVPAVLADDFAEYVKAAGLAYVSTGKNIEDTEKYVRDAAARFLGSAKKFHQVQSAEYAKLKKDDAKITSPDGNSAIASETKRPRSTWTPQEWEKHLETVNL